MMHSNFSIGHHDKAPAPSFEVLGLEHCLNSLDKSPAAGISQPDDLEPLMKSGWVSSDIRTAELRCDEKPLGFLRGAPDR